MDLKYHDGDQWVSLKTVCGVEGVEDTPVNDDSTFATPKYITSKVITKDENNLIKYYDGTILNKEIALGSNPSQKTFVSKIELKEENGTVTLTPTYGKIVEDENGIENGNIVSNISFNTDGDLKVTKGNLSENLLNLISSGSELPTDNTKGFFYLQIEEGNNSEASA